MVKQEIRQFVFLRAKHRCEYCGCPLSHSSQPYDVEHIVPVCKNGTDEFSNLACACGGCNAHKFTKTHATDPISKLTVPLYHPRLMDWRNHFTWSDDYTIMMGITPIGRATIEALQLNRAGNVNLRSVLLLVGLHPPKI